MNDDKILCALKDKISDIVKDAVLSSSRYSNFDELDDISVLIDIPDFTSPFIKFKASYDGYYDDKSCSSEFRVTNSVDIDVSFNYSITKGITCWHFEDDETVGNAEVYTILKRQLESFVNRIEKEIAEKEKTDINDNKILRTLSDNLSRIVKNVINEGTNGYKDLFRERVIKSDIVYGEDGTTSIKFKGRYDRLYESKPNYSEIVDVVFTYNLDIGISNWKFWSNYNCNNGDHVRKILTFSIMNFVTRLSMAPTDTDTQKPITNPDMTVGEVIETFTPEQYKVFKYCVGAAITETESKANSKIEELKKDLKAACDDYWALRAKLKVKNVISNYPAIIVFWEDGTKTVVKAKDEPFDMEKGIAMAFTKKALGNDYAAGGRLKAIIKHVKIETNKGERKAIKKATIKPVEEVKTETVKNEKENVKMNKPKKADFVKALLEKGYTKAEAERAWKGMNTKEKK